MTLTEAQNIIEAGAPGPYYHDSYRRFEEEYLPTVTRLIGELLPRRALEIGPGWGTTMLWMAAQGWAVEVWDMIPKGVWITDDLLDKASATFRCRDIFEGPLQTEAYDLIVMTQVLAHLKHRPDPAVATCRAMLRPGGTLIVTALDPHFAHAHSTYRHWREVPEYGTAEPCPDMVVCLYETADLEELLRTSFAEVTVWQEGLLNYGVCVREA
jgi:SAM-dependent methyltransferase